MRKSLLIKAIPVTAVILAAAAFIACQSLGQILKEPELAIKSVELLNMNFTGVDFLCKVNVKNPNAFAIPFPKLDWKLFINKNGFINGTIQNDNFIQAQRSTVVEVPFTMAYQEVFKSIQSLIGKNQADYKVAIALRFDVPVLGEKIFHLEHDGTVPLLTVPSISFKGISVKNISLTKLDFELNWELENNNIFAMNINEFTYNLNVNKSRLAAGTIPRPPRIEAGKKTLVPLSFSLNGLAAVKEITEIITTGSDAAYSCGGAVSLGADLPGMKLDMPFDFSGVTKLRK